MKTSSRRPTNAPMRHSDIPLVIAYIEHLLSVLRRSDARLRILGIPLTYDPRARLSLLLCELVVTRELLCRRYNVLKTMGTALLVIVSKIAVELQS
jgi:hypothetical protein